MPTRGKSTERPWKKSPRCHSNMLACNGCPQQPHYKCTKVFHLHVLSDTSACNLTRCKLHTITTDMHTTHPVLSHSKRHREQIPTAHTITAWSAHCTFYLVYCTYKAGHPGAVGLVTDTCAANVRLPGLSLLSALSSSFPAVLTSPSRCFASCTISSALWAAGLLLCASSLCGVPTIAISACGSELLCSCVGESASSACSVRPCDSTHDTSAGPNATGCLRC